MTIQELQAKFGIPGAVRFEEGRGGLVRVAVNTSHAEAHVYTHGAHVTHWQPAGAAPVLFLSQRSVFQPGKPIRGGVPVCFPWFGPNARSASLPMHGFARLMEWAVESVRQQGAGEVALTLVLRSNDQTRSFWPHEFELRHTVTVGAELTMALETRNTGKEPFTVTEALHTYLRVGDVRKIEITGLENTDYIDKVAGGRRENQGSWPITFTGETDRVYAGTRAATVLNDPGLGRRIVVEKSGSSSTVVWNPWIAKAAAMPDFGDDEWPGMVCVETANAADDAVTVAPGESQTMTARIRLIGGYER